jgi:cyclophilin family peptidyl-prolyl cis-trans isomerase
MTPRIFIRSALVAGFAACILAISACGSGSGSSPAAVSEVTAVNPAVGKVTTFNILGANLPASIAATTTGCSNVAVISSTSATSRQFTCTPDGTSVAVSIDYGSTSPYKTSLAVPLPQVTFVTSVGTVVVELYPDKAPVTVKNFLNYVASGFYSNTIFHRVVPGFVTQGGGFVSDPVNTIQQKANSTAPIILESKNGLSNLKYTLAMARLGQPDTATSQFYFNAVNNTSLDNTSTTAVPNGYAVFGKAISGMAVLDSMNAVANASLTSGAYSGYTNVPTTALVLQSAIRTQ